MRAAVNEALMIDGRIAEVVFTPEKNRVSVKFEDEGNFVFDFSNAKKPRADHVRKLRLKAGDHVIAIGTKYGTSTSRGYGFEIMRSGKVSEGNYAIIRGEVERAVKASRKTVLYLRADGIKTTFAVTCDAESVKDIHAGETVSCLCSVKEIESCQQSECRNMSVARCGSCSKRKPQKRYEAFRICLY